MVFPAAGNLTLLRQRITNPSASRHTAPANGLRAGPADGPGSARMSQNPPATGRVPRAGTGAARG